MCLSVFFVTNAVNFEECYKSKAWRYKGNLSVTHNGRQCQGWDSQSPHAHEFSNPAGFPDKTIADAENFCRSPDRQYTPWCFTKDPLVPWEYCPIHSCSKGMP
jgi:integrin beta 3